MRFKKLFSIDIDTFSCSDTVIVKSSLSISATNISISNDASSSIIWFSISWIEGPSLTGRILITREKSSSDKPVPSNTLKTMVSKQFPSVINISGKGVYSNKRLSIFILPYKISPIESSQLLLALSKIIERLSFSTSKT